MKIIGEFEHKTC